MKRSLLVSLFVGALLTCGSVAQASGLSFQTGNGFYTALGLEAGYPSDYDHLRITGASGSITGAPTYKIASLDFIAGYNAWNIHDATGTFTVDFAINTSHATLTLPYTIHIDYQDTLKLLIGQASLVYGGNTFIVLTDPVMLTSTGGGNPRGTLSADLNASISQVPLPPALLLMASALGLMGFFGRRKA